MYTQKEWHEQANGTRVTADAYYEAAQSLEQSLKEPFARMAPIGSTAAFACELYLKALLFEKNIEEKNCHKLRDLHRKLPNNIADEIEKATMRITHATTIAANTFDGHLEDISNAFVDLRYLHEIEKYTLYQDFLFCYMNALKTVADKHLPITDADGGTTEQL